LRLITGTDSPSKAEHSKAILALCPSSKLILYVTAVDVQAIGVPSTTILQTLWHNIDLLTAHASDADVICNCNAAAEIGIVARHSHCILLTTNHHASTPIADMPASHHHSMRCWVQHMSALNHSALKNPPQH
jgi:hypothetical protein